MDDLLKVKDFLEKNVNKLTEENISLETTKTELEARVSKLESEIKTTRSQLFNQKKISREDSERSSLEVDTMKSELENATKRERETFNKMMILEKELENVRDNHRALKRET